MYMYARWFFRRKSGYMSPYLLRTVIRVVISYHRRGIPLDPIFLRVGDRYLMVWKGNR